MRVAELMQTEVETIAADAPVNDAFVTLADSRISALPVLNDTGRLMGVISRSDILASEEEAEEQAGREALFEDTSVQDLMTSPPLTIPPDASVREAANLMLSAGVHHLIVTEGERIAGIISTTDIVRAVALGRVSV